MEIIPFLWPQVRLVNSYPLPRYREHSGIGLNSMLFLLGGFGVLVILEVMVDEMDAVADLTASGVD